MKPCRTCQTPRVRDVTTGKIPDCKTCRAQQKRDAYVKRARKPVAGLAFNGHAERAIKNDGGSWFNIGSPGQKVTNRNPVHAGTKGEAGGWFNDNKRSGKDSSTGILSRSGSKSSVRRAASAAIARIPDALSQHIAHTFYPRDVRPQAASTP